MDHPSKLSARSDEDQNAVERGNLPGSRIAATIARP